MVQEPGPLPMPLSVLSLETRTALRDALERYLAQPSDPTGLRPALRLVTAEARARAIRAEELMVAFKALWRTLPPLRPTTDPRLRAELLERLITTCIEEYYAS